MIRSLLALRALDARDATIAGGVMLGAAATWSVVPHTDDVACPLRTLTGVPCPLCGMTTSVVDTVHLNLADAVAANPAGPILVALAAGLLVIRPKSVPISPVLILTALLSMWIFQLFRFGLL